MFGIRGETEDHINIFEPAARSSRNTFQLLDSNSRSTIADSNKKPSVAVDASSCGEPFVAQHIVLDFTPKLDEDNEYVQKKCCDFWDFIKGVPEIQNLMVYPEKPQKSSQGTLETVPSEPGADSNITENDINSVKSEENAITVLEYLNEKCISSVCFGTKLPRTTCSLGSREYKQSGEPQQSHKWRKGSGMEMSSHGRIGPSKKPEIFKTKVVKLHDWDAKHPKSMKPPGHPPSLQNSVLQRAKCPHKSPHKCTQKSPRG